MHKRPDCSIQECCLPSHTGCNGSMTSSQCRIRYNFHSVCTSSVPSVIDLYSMEFNSFTLVIRLRTFFSLSLRVPTRYHLSVWLAWLLFMARAVFIIIIMISIREPYEMLEYGNWNSGFIQFISGRYKGYRCAIY